MKIKSLLIALGLFALSFTPFPVDGSNPVFATEDNLNEYGPSQKSKQLTTKGKENIEIPISYRHKLVKNLP